MIDLFSRRVIGWSMSATMAAQLVANALKMAVWRRGKRDALLHHSDQGNQYQRAVPGSSGRPRRDLQHEPVRQHVGQRGDGELLLLAEDRTHGARKIYRTRDQARADVFDYIERFYNPRRRHSTIVYLSPMDFERTAASA